MESQIDFLNTLEHDMSIKILKCLDDSTDLVRLSCVSNSWRHFVITNGFCKQLCLRMIPQLSRVAHVTKEPEDVRSNIVDNEWEMLEREHHVYGFLAKCFNLFSNRNCIHSAICASSTADYACCGIENTLKSKDRYKGSASCWCSKGQQDPTVPESLIYKLNSELCVISVIKIKLRPVKGRLGLTWYSANAVRFRMGHMKSSVESSENVSSDDMFVWTYTSQEFPIAQGNRLQRFKLPELVPCIGGIFQIELFGGVQSSRELNGLFYIGVSLVEILGKSLSPPFGVEILENSGKFVLKAPNYHPYMLVHYFQEDMERVLREWKMF